MKIWCGVKITQNENSVWSENHTGWITWLRVNKHDWQQLSSWVAATEFVLKCFYTWWFLLLLGDKCREDFLAKSNFIYRSIVIHVYNLNISKPSPHNWGSNNSSILLCQPVVTRQFHMVCMGYVWVSLNSK